MKKYQLDRIPTWEKIREQKDPEDHISELWDRFESGNLSYQQLKRELDQYRQSLADALVVTLDPPTKPKTNLLKRGHD